MAGGVALFPKQLPHLLEYRNSVLNNVFQLATPQKICKLRGWTPGSEKNKETHELMMCIWEGIRAIADKDNDGQVSDSAYGGIGLCCAEKERYSVLVNIGTIEVDGDAFQFLQLLFFFFLIL